MKTLFILLFTTLWLGANDGVHEFAPSAECQKCHEQIYDEFYGSMHANATPEKDAIHAAVWNKQVAMTKTEQYSCAKCHTPAADNLDKMTKAGEKGIFDASNPTHQEAISCAYCHRIEKIEEHKQSNTNVISKTPKSYYGSTRSTLDSPYHKIMTEENENFTNGNVCVGCHSHNVNKFGLNLCSTNVNGEMNSANCVSCHMPRIDGSSSSIIDTKTHSFHGFAGAHLYSEMLTKYVDISLLKNIDHFIVNVDNKSSHALLLHPARVAVLKISVTRGEKTTELEKELFVRIIGKDGKPSMPWMAEEIVKDTMIQANEKRAVKRDFKLQEGDRVDVVLGWFLVNPKAVESLGLKDEKTATEFKVFKKQSFTF